MNVGQGQAEAERVVCQYFYVEGLPLEPRRKTRDWDIINLSSGDKLGQIRWYGTWRQYCFFPEGNTVWSKGCLNDVLEAIERIRTRET